MAQAPTQDFIVKSGLNVQGTSTVTSSTGNTSTLQVDGGAAIARNLIVGEDTVIYGDLTLYGIIPNLTVTTGTFTSLTVTDLSTLNAVTAGVTTASQLTVNSRLAVGGLSELNNAIIANQTNATSATSGALQVGGGVGIQKDLWVGGRAWVGGYEVITTATILASTLQQVTEQGSSTTVAISILNTLSSTSATSGALTVAGGVGVGGDIYASGKLYIGNGTVSYANLTTATSGLYASRSINLIDTNASVKVSRISNTNAPAVELQAVNTSGVVRSYWDVSVSTGAGGVDDNMGFRWRTTNLSSLGGADRLLMYGTGTALVVIPMTTATNSTATGAFVVKGGVGIGGGLFVGGISTFTSLVNSLGGIASTDIVASGTLGVTGTSYLVDVQVTNIVVSGTLGVTGTSVLAGLTTVTNITSATSTNTGALQVLGGVGVGGSLYAKDLYSDGSHVITAASLNYLLQVGTDTAISTATGNIIIWNTSTLQTITDRGSITSNAVLITNNTSAISTDSGALQVTGGAGVGGNLYVGGTIYGTLVGAGSITTATNLSGGTAGQVPYQISPGVTNFYGPGTAGNVLVSNGANAPTYNNTLTLTSTLSNTTTVAGNALQVVGGVGIAGSLFVDGPAYFANNVLFYGTSTSIFSTSTVYTDNYIDLHFPSGSSGESGVWTVDDGKDIGHIYHHYKIDTGDEHGALIWHNASDELRWYMGGVELNTSTQVWDVSTATFGVFRTGTLLLQNTTTATSTSTGTLVVAGGVGIGGNLHVGGTSVLRVVNATSATFSGTLGVTGTSTLGVLNATTATFSGLTTVTNVTSATSTTTGALQVRGGVGVGGEIWSKGAVHILDSTPAGASQGALFVSGGVTIGIGLSLAGSYNQVGNFQTTGLSTLTNTTAAMSTSTGALQVRGGVGIGGALYVQQTSYINGAQIITTATLGSYGVSAITAGTDTVVSSSTGSVVIWNTSTLQSITNRGFTTTNQIVIINTTTATATNTGALQVVGGVGIGGALYVGGTSTLAGVQATNIVASGTLGVTGTSILAGVQATNIVASGTLGVTGTSILAGVQATNIVASGTLGVTGTSILNGLQATNIVASGTLGVTGTSILAGVRATNIVASGTLGVTGTSTLSLLNATSATFSGTLGVTGTSTLGLLNATSATFSGTLGVTGTSVFAGLTSITNATSATSTTTGALQVIGGVGIGGALYVQRTSYINNAEILTTATIGSYGVSSVTAGTDTKVTTSTGAVLIWNTSTLQTITDRGASTTNLITFNNGVQFGSTANTPIDFPGSFTNQNGTFIRANGVMVGTTTSTALYALNFQHQVAPVSTTTIGSYYGNLFLPTLSNTATYTNMYGTFARIDMAAAATTGSVATWYGFFSATPSRNAAANVRFTNHIGFYAQDPSSSITATNVYGVQSVVASGTNRYNIYASGTADNYFNGNVGIGGLPTVKLDVTGAVKISGITTVTNATTSISTTTGALIVAGGIGVGDSIYVENRVGFVNTSNVSVVYQYYNAATNSLDTVFG